MPKSSVLALGRSVQLLDLFYHRSYYIGLSILVQRYRNDFVLQRAMQFSRNKQISPQQLQTSVF